MCLWRWIAVRCYLWIRWWDDIVEVEVDVCTETWIYRNFILFSFFCWLVEAEDRQVSSSRPRARYSEWIADVKVIQGVKMVAKCLWSLQWSVGEPGDWKLSMYDLCSGWDEGRLHEAVGRRPMGYDWWLLSGLGDRLIVVWGPERLLRSCK